MNAIILAAGLGSRFNEITKYKHKALLPINNIPNIERTILYLLDAGITEIYVITGHLREQFTFLERKYNCHLIYNEKYQEYNSIYSFYKGLEFFNDSYVIDSDVVLFKNIFKNRLDNSCYFVINRPDNVGNMEWVPILNDDGKIIEIKVTDDNLPSLLGVSYWTKEDSIKIKDELKNWLDVDKLLMKSLYWDNIPMKLIDKLNVNTVELSISEGYEMDNLEQYEFILKELASE